MEESVLPNGIENLELESTMEKVTLANNEVYIGKISNALCSALAKEAEDELENIKVLSMSYSK